MLWAEADAEVRSLQPRSGNWPDEDSVTAARQRADHFRLALDWARASVQGKQGRFIIVMGLKKALGLSLILLVLLAFLAWWKDSSPFSAPFPQSWPSLLGLFGIALVAGLLHGFSAWEKGKHAFANFVWSLEDSEKRS